MILRVSCVVCVCVCVFLNIILKHTYDILHVRTKSKKNSNFFFIKIFTGLLVRIECKRSCGELLKKKVNMILHTTLFILLSYFLLFIISFCAPFFQSSVASTSTPNFLATFLNGLRGFGKPS